MDISFELYKIFYHAASSGGFSAAAQKLFISQSAVSQAVKNLEEKMGCLLFIRKGRTVRLTTEGELLFRHVEQAYNFIKTAEKKITEIRELYSGEIRIGVGDTVCKHFLIPCMQKFNERYPEIRIQVINRTSSQITGLLKNGTVDFGIVTLPVPDKEIKTIEFITVEDIFAASAVKFPNLSGRKSNLKELLDLPLLMLQKDSSTRRNLDSLLSNIGLKAEPEIELESVDLLVEFAKIGLGIAHVLKESALPSIKRGELFEVRTFEQLPGRRLGIATMDNVPLSLASSQFINFLTNL